MASISLSEGDPTRPQLPDVVPLGEAKIPSPPTDLGSLLPLRGLRHQPTPSTHSLIHVDVREQTLLAAKLRLISILAFTALLLEVHTVGVVDLLSTTAVSAT